MRTPLLCHHLLIDMEIAEMSRSGRGVTTVTGTAPFQALHDNLALSAAAECAAPDNQPAVEGGSTRT